MSNAFFQGGAKSFSGETKPSAHLLVSLRAWYLVTIFLLFISLYCPQLFFCPPALPTFRRPCLSCTLVCACVRKRGRIVISCLVVVWLQEKMLWGCLPQSGSVRLRLDNRYR